VRKYGQILLSTICSIIPALSAFECNASIKVVGSLVKKRVSLTPEWQYVLMVVRLGA